MSLTILVERERGEIEKKLYETYVDLISLIFYFN